MKELHGTEWYGEYATLTDEHNDYVQIEYKCNGTGRLYDYTLFPGIDLIFIDFNCSDTFYEPIPNKNIIEIRHYQKGRVEFELKNNKVLNEDFNNKISGNELKELLGHTPLEVLCGAVLGIAIGIIVPVLRI